MQASIFSCSTAFLAWEMLAVLLLAIPSFMVLLWRQAQAQRGTHRVNEHHIKSTKQHLPWRCLCPPLEQPFSTTTFLFKGPILSGGGDLFYSSSILSEERALKAAAGQRFVIFQSVLMHDYLFFLFFFWLFFTRGWEGGGALKLTSLWSRTVHHRAQVLCSFASFP